MASSSTGGRSPIEGDSARQAQTVRTRPPALPREAAAPAEADKPEAQWRANVARGARHCGRMGFYTLVPMVLLVAIAAGVLFVRLRHGPIAFDSVVAPIQRGINAELVSNSVKIKGAELRLGDSGEFEFRLRDVSIFDVRGQPILSSPLAALSLSMPALMRGRIVPSRIELIDPVIKLSYSEGSGLEFERSEPAGASPEIKPSGSESTATTIEKSSEESAKLNLAKMLSDASRRARKRLDATSYLTEFGISNGTVVVEYQGRQSSWRIDEASFDFNHARRRSVISGRASIASSKGPWALSFIADESDKTNKLQVKATVRDLVPSTVAAAAPPFALLKMFELPVSADATIDLSTDGEVVASEVAVQVGEGHVSSPGLSKPLDVSAGVIRLGYDGQARLWTMKPSPVKWGDGTLLFAGQMKDVAEGDGPPQWNFAIDGTNGVFEAPEFSVPPVTIDTWHAEGSIVPRRGEVDISQFNIAGGGGSAKAKVAILAGAKGISLTSDVTLSPMPLATLKALWPRGMGAGAREWIGHNVSNADFRGGTIHYSNAGAETPPGEPIAPGAEKLNVNVEAQTARFVPLPGMPQIEAPNVLVQIRDNALEIDAADAAFALEGDRQVPLKAAHLHADDVMVQRPDASIEFTTLGPLANFLDAIETLPIRAVREASPLPKAGEGKVEAHLEIKLPLIATLNSDDIAIAGKARITDGRFGKVAGRFDIQGFSLDLNLTETALDAKGDLLVNGVPAKIVGQRLLTAEDKDQPPVKIVANLDEADRKQLGMDVNDIVHGSVPVEISWQKGDRPEPAIKVHADLTAAEITLDQIEWRKMAGRQATLDTDIVSGQARGTELDNFKIASDDISVEGKIEVGPDNKVKSFSFPSVALNFVSRLAADGNVGKDGIWNISVKSTTFDGRNIFKGLFNVNKTDRNAHAKNASAGARIDAKVDTLIGGSDVSMKNVKLTMVSRGGKLTDLDARGSVDHGAAFAAVLDHSSGARRMLIDCSDAGQLLKLVDFYTNMQGGRLRLEVNLDGEGAADKTGVLWVENFQILGDPIVSEVVSSGDQGRPAIGGGRHTVTREIFEFDRMRAPFSIGYGQFVLNESYVKGPLVGANLRGKIDFKTKRVNIGGTYIPLQGLNGALGGIPLLGQILSGTQGEGIFGITFAVQGPTADPQVVVNPISLVAPGIFRDMFQMTAADPKVQVREDPAPEVSAEKRVRSSSTAATGTDAPKKSSKPQKGRAQADAVDGWSSTTTSP